ncbi:MAG TPA: EAL domain-containing protein [Xanthomonadaceae bacterium]|nr:EAL domain-containing protein [Xanthomonadaceae bacterium]
MPLTSAPGCRQPTRPARDAFAGIVLGLLALAATAPAVAARRDFYFQSVQSERGLAQNSVNALMQDRRGFVWIATQGGLHRYDGADFRLFQHRADDPDSIPDSFVTAIAEGPDGTLFVGTNTHHVSALDLASGRFRRYSQRPAGSVSGRGDTVRALLYRSGMGLLVGTGTGIDLLDPDTGARRQILRLRTPASQNPLVTALEAEDAHTVWAATHDGLYRVRTPGGLAERAGPDLAAHSVLVAADGEVWFGLSDGLYRKDAEGAIGRVWPDDGEHGPAVVALAQDLQGRLWMSMAEAGLARFDPASGAVRKLQYRPELPASLPEQSIGPLMVDRAGLLWLGGFVRGVATTDTRGAPFEYVADLDSGRDLIATNNIRVLHQDREGALWLGTEGDGLKRYDLQSDRFDSFAPVLARALGEHDPVANLRVLGIVPADDGKLWISANRGLFLLDPVARQARLMPVTVGDPSRGDRFLRSLMRARDGSLWIGTFSAGVVHYHPASGQWHGYRHDPDDAGSLSHDLVNCTWEDGRGRIWIGTLDGLNVLDPSSGRMQRLLHDPVDPQSLSGNLVRAVVETRDGSRWVATHSGLNRAIEHADGRIGFERIGTEQGLPDPTVYGVLEDARGRLWLSGNNGISRFDRATGEFRRFGLRDGLQELEFNGGAYLALADGRMAFGGIKGLNVFDAERIEPSTFEPNLALTALRVGDDPGNLATLLPPERIVVPQSARLLRLGFAALDYTSAGQNRYRYRLDGFDQDWVEAGTRTEATYTNLDPGNYVFRVLGTNHDGHWSSRELSVPVRIEPSWWNHPLALLGYVLLGAGAAALTVVLARRRRDQEQVLLREISEREERLKLSLWGSGDEFWDWNVRENSLYRLGADQLLGLKQEHVISTDDWRTRAVHPDDLPRVQRILKEHIDGQTEYFESEHRIRNADGAWVWVRSRGKVVERDSEGNPLRIAGTARDITASRRAERDRRIASEVLRSMGEAVAVTDLDLRFVSINQAFSRMTGYSESEVIGEPSSMLDSQQHSDDFYRRVHESVERTGHWQGEMWQRRKDGDEFLSWLEMSEVRDAQGVRTHFVAVLADITDKKRAEQELRYLANYDTLTGLPNRTLLSERLARAVVRARRQDNRVAVLFLDLDRFKDINDSMGHAAGDRILKAAAARLLTTMRETDTVARLGGDEFTVVLEETADVASAEQVAIKILQAFSDPLEIDGRTEVQITPSIGISLYPDHGLVPTDLLKFADTAMYQAKERGRNTYQVYTEAMDADAKRRANMIASLRRALERGEFRLVYQPRLSLLDGEITGVEALLRWHSAEFGEIDPTVFIPLAEETGLILPIGEWVLDEALRTLVRWRHHGMDSLSMAVNVSVLQILRGDLPGLMRRVLAETGIPPDRLELEVTESMVMANAEQTVAVLGELKRLGLTLAIDDFGTGYSSLVYLKRLPIDTLKIDKEFIGDLTTDPDDEAITATVITMAHSLGLNVVAEGVETREQLAYLHEQGCDEIQGFWLSPALDVHHCMAFIRGYKPGLESRPSVIPTY